MNRNEPDQRLMPRPERRPVTPRLERMERRSPITGPNAVRRPVRRPTTRPPTRERTALRRETTMFLK